MLENTEGAIKKEQSTETEKTKKTKQKHNTIYLGHHYAQTNTNNVNKTSWANIYIFIYTKSYIIYDLALMKFASHSGIYFSVFSW